MAAGTGDGIILGITVFSALSLIVGAITLGYLCTTPRHAHHRRRRHATKKDDDDDVDADSTCSTVDEIAIVI